MKQRSRGLSGARGNGWDGLTRDEMSWQQRAAAKTRGFATVPNAISLGSFGTSAAGVVEAASGHYITGAIMFALGSAGDVVDGPYARKFGVNGIVGEAIDAGFDKARIVGALTVFALFDIMPAAEAVPIAATQVAIASISTVGNKRGKVMHAGRGGKDTAFLATAAAGCGVVSTALDSIANSPIMHDVATGFEVGGVAFTVGAVGLGLATAYNYGKQAFAKQPTPTDITLPTTEAAINTP